MRIFVTVMKLEIQREMEAPWRKQSQESNPGPSDWNAPDLSMMPRCLQNKYGTRSYDLV